jgi:HSP20 family protein
MSLIKRTFPNFSTFNDEFFQSKFSNENWLPAINISDNKENYELELAAPGFNKEDFKLTIENKQLVISGESKSEKEEKEKNYTRKEFRSSSFTRSFNLPENVSEENIQAEYKDGVLIITLAKKQIEAPEYKSIEIS